MQKIKESTKWAFCEFASSQEEEFNKLISPSPLTNSIIPATAGIFLTEYVSLQTHRLKKVIQKSC
jgi:hypothetical protein